MIEKKLRDFSLNVSLVSTQNEIIALLGDSGSGKSMTLKSLAGIVTPDCGYIKVNDRILYNSYEKINLPVRHRKVGYLFQNYALFPNMSVEENILICMEPKNRDYCQQLLKIFHIEELAQRYPHQLSGGQQQRAAIARMIAVSPEILLFDEPFSALDTNLRWAIENDLREFFTSYKKSVIFVTHNKNEAFRLSDKIAIIHNGQIKEFDSKDKIFNYPQNIATAKMIGIKNFSTVKQLKQNKAYLEDYHLTLPMTIEENISSVAFHSRDFHLQEQKDDIAIPMVIQNYVVDTESVFIMGKCNDAILTLEFPRNKIHLEELFTNSQNNEQTVYYPKARILQLRR